MRLNSIPITSLPISLAFPVTTKSKRTSRQCAKLADWRGLPICWGRGRVITHALNGPEPKDPSPPRQVGIASASVHSRRFWASDKLVKLT